MVPSRFIFVFIIITLGLSACINSSQGVVADTLPSDTPNPKDIPTSAPTSTFTETLIPTSTHTPIPSPTTTLTPTIIAYILEKPPDTCPVTKPPNPAFTPPESYPTNPPGTDAWYGTNSLWTTVTENGTWYGLPHTPEGYAQKVFWWRNGYDPMKEPEPNLTVSGRRLDGNAPAFHVSQATNAEAGDIGSAILVGVYIPTLGCWEITGQYADSTLSFIVWVAP